MKTLARKKINERGIFLLETVVLIILLAFLGAAGLLMVMGRAMVVNKVVSSQKNRFHAQDAQSILNTCLQNVTPAACNDPTTFTNCGFPMITATGKQITVQASWSNGLGLCQATLVVNDP